MWMWYAQETMLSVSAALELMLQTVAPFAAEPIPLPMRLGLSLAEDVRSDIDSPPFDKSQMDGFAVRVADVASGTATLHVIEQITAGKLPTKSLGPGEAAQIMTGPVAGRADAVVKIEECAVTGDRVRIVSKPVMAGQYIVRRGSNLQADDLLLQAGTNFGRHIGLHWRKSERRLVTAPVGRAWRSWRRGTNWFPWISNPARGRFAIPMNPC
ncbi:MAG: hypothetical protein U0872_01705 [Planctomycetaceae bacterium]